MRINHIKVHRIQELKTSDRENLKNKENKTHDVKRNSKNDNQPHGGQRKMTVE